MPGGGGGRFIGRGLRTPQEMSSEASNAPAGRRARRPVRQAPVSAGMPAAGPQPAAGASRQVSTNSSVSPMTEAPEQYREALANGTFDIGGVQYKAKPKVVMVRGKPYVFLSSPKGMLHVPLDRVGQLIDDHMVARRHCPEFRLRR